jgi:hypothetical protein
VCVYSSSRPYINQSAYIQVHVHHRPPFSQTPTQVCTHTYATRMHTPRQYKISYQTRFSLLKVLPLPYSIWGVVHTAYMAFRCTLNNSSNFCAGADWRSRQLVHCHNIPCLQAQTALHIPCAHTGTDRALPYVRGHTRTKHISLQHHVHMYMCLCVRLLRAC